MLPINNLFTLKQQHCWDVSLNGGHRWNIQEGATSSGKTYLTYFLIAERFRRLKNQGLIVFIGNTQATLERNILDPMRNIWGAKRIGKVNNENKVVIFKKVVYCLGADNKRRVDKLQGSTIEYCYGDEMATWDQSVFEMLKSRLRCDNSVFDGTTNPDAPTHWLKKFIDSDADVFVETYTLYDNTFLPDKFVKNLELEYKGTIYYDRFILGKWQHAEGVVFEWFANDTTPYFIDEDNEILNRLNEITIGLDIGGNGSKTVAVVNGFTYDGIVIKLFSRELDHRGGLVDPDNIYRMVYSCILDVAKRGFKGVLRKIYIDSAEQVIRVGLKRYLQKLGYKILIENSVKTQFKERELAYIHLLKNGKMFFLKEAQSVVDALATAMRDPKDESRLLDNGTTDVDTFDADYYSFSSRIKTLIKRGI